MRPKEFQTQALDVFEQFLAELKKQQDEATKRITALEQADLSVSDNDRDYFAKTWEELGRRGILPRVKEKDGSLSVPPYIRRQDSHGRIYTPRVYETAHRRRQDLAGRGGNRTEATGRRPGALDHSLPRDFPANLAGICPSSASLPAIPGARLRWVRVKLLKKTDAFTLADVENHLCRNAAHVTGG